MKTPTMIDELAMRLVAAVTEIGRFDDNRTRTSDRSLVDLYECLREQLAECDPTERIEGVAEALALIVYLGRPTQEDEPDPGLDDLCRTTSTIAAVLREWAASRGSSKRRDRGRRP